MKVKFLMLKFMDNNFNLIDTLVSLNKKEYAFFKQIATNLHENMFLAGELRIKICRKLNISSGTYWRRIDRMVELDFIFKSSRGVYRINSNWVKVFALSKEGAEMDKMKKQIMG